MRYHNRNRQILVHSLHEGLVHMDHIDDDQRSFLCSNDDDESQRRWYRPGQREDTATIVSSLRWLRSRKKRLDSLRIKSQEWEINFHPVLLNVLRSDLLCLGQIKVTNRNPGYMLECPSGVKFLSKILFLWPIPLIFWQIFGCNIQEIIRQYEFRDWRGIKVVAPMRVRLICGKFTCSSFT